MSWSNRFSPKGVKIGISCKSVEASKYTVKCSCKIQRLIRNYEDNETPLLYRKQDEKGSVVSLVSLVYAFLASYFFFVLINPDAITSYIRLQQL